MKIKEKILALIRCSIILCALNRLSEFLYRQLRESVLGVVFSAYSTIEEKFHAGMFANLLKREKRGKLLNKVRYTVAKAFEKNSLLGLISGLLDYFLGCRLKVYGLFLLPFGIYASLIYVVKKYALYLETAGTEVLYLGIGTIVISLLLIPSKITLAASLESSAITRFVLSDTLGVRMENLSHRSNKHKGGSSILFFVAGVVAGILTLFVSPFHTIALVFALIALGLVFSYPEFGVLVMIFISPFISFLPHPMLFLVGAVFLTVLSYVIKLIRGKRTFRLELIDVIVIIFMVLVVFGGLISATSSASLEPALIYACLMLAYLIVVNLMQTKLWMKRTVSVLVCSASVVCIYGIWHYFVGIANENRIGQKFLGDIGSRAISTLESPNVLAGYIIMVLPFALAVFLYSKKATTKILYFGALASMTLCLVYTWSQSAWMGLIIGLAVFFLIYSKRTLYFIIIALALLPLVSLILPTSIVEQFVSIENSSVSALSFFDYICEPALHMIRDCFAGGIGIGESAFSGLSPLCTSLGADGAMHSHSIYLKMILDIGIVGVFVFLLIVFRFSQSAFEYTGKTNDKRSKLMVAAGLAGVIAILVQGFTEYIWYNYRVFFVFWIVIAIVCAYRRIGYEDETGGYLKKEENAAWLDIRLSGRS